METHRLILRQLESNDAEAIFAYQSNKENFPYVDMPIYTNIAEAKTYIEKMNTGIKDKKWVIWAIADNKTNSILGTISIWNISNDLETADLGYGLFPGNVGRGIMSEALVKVLDYGFNEIGLNTIEACTNTLNQKSIYLLKRNHFNYSSSFTEPASNGGTIKMDVYSITKR
ncbi:hypothetical protein BSG1_11261 [Bacillus sp. SG-1]|nr:hypothetical protein BSG1_11261 [Bacillus sp. SG-1]